MVVTLSRSKFIVGLLGGGLTARLDFDPFFFFRFFFFASPESLKFSFCKVVSPLVAPLSENESFKSPSFDGGGLAGKPVIG